MGYSFSTDYWFFIRTKTKSFWSRDSAFFHWDENLNCCPVTSDICKQ
uniref:Uncharacterized protein n=1 Tax=Rhizophora mucronata TaxID=61149 RepID=A0A2P2PPZ3_RHIMU